ncbi:aldehyde dehydrogenase family protein [Candidatus Cyanaurora vandensis]|uniref:aldehyde dehydrogenase family protein n=1 Tax=Candidatus Cyanaurora vandensis TaxID=2714958 RepID=UPI00257F2BF6|nr:aldehyde dehydrogenase family protein [Candidatus Cyanaurora vandensis]
MSQPIRTYTRIQNQDQTQYPPERVSVNPARFEDEVGLYPITPLAGVKQACEAARQAFPSWRKVPAPLRGNLIYNLGQLVSANKTVLASWLTREVGKPYSEALGSVQEVIDTCQFFVSEGRRLYGQTVPSEMADKRLFTYRRPVGVCGIITAGNFPIAVPAWYVVPALLCGNTVVWKPSEDAPVLSYLFCQLVEKAGFPPGVFNMVLGDGATTGAALVSMVSAGLVDKIGFTGSTAVGQRIGRVAGENLQVPCLELGGKNPLVVTERANLELAVEGALWSAFGTAGQRCTSLGVLIVQERIYEEFIARLLERTAAMVIGDPTDPSITYGPLISKRFLDNLLAFQKNQIQAHHQVLTPTIGQITRENPWPNFVGDPAAGYFAHPVLVGGARREDVLYQEETFGPLVAAVSYGELEEALDWANGHGYGLSSAIYTQDPAEAFYFQENIQAGMVSINNTTSGAEAHMPFGGNGRSGNGSRQSGVWVLDQFTRWQGVNWDFSNQLQRAQIDTIYSPGDLDYRVPGW